MTFKKLGGTYQFQVRNEQDLARIDDVDAARWAVTSAPTRDLHCDPAFLAHMDADAKGRIRVSQVIAARDWVFERLSRRSRLHEQTDLLRLADIDPSPAGALLRKAADHVLAELGAGDRTTLSLAQLRNYRANYINSLANGDGIVCPENIPEPKVAELVRDVMATVGSRKDLSGRPGVGTEELEQFLKDARAYAEWKTRPAAEADRLLPWGEATAAAATLVRDLDGKVEEFFWHCDLIRQEELTADMLRKTPDEAKALRGKDAPAIVKLLSEAPLAPPNPEAKLVLGGALNPVYEERVEQLRRDVLPRALGAAPAELTRASWRRVKAIFDPWLAWQASRPKEAFEKLQDETIAADLEGPLVERARHYIAIDLAAAEGVAQLADLEKLILFQRWLVELVNNFVNLSHLYDPELAALLEMGTLVVDGRRLEFTVKVDDREAHKKVASASLMFLVYAEVIDQDAKTPAFQVVAPVTAGERGRLIVGKRGIFVGLDGKEWDATIVDVVENPISLAEAIKAPFRRAGSFVNKKIEGFAQSKLQEQEAKALDVSVTAPVAATPAPAAPPAKDGSSSLQNLAIGGGIALAGLSTALGLVVNALSNVALGNVFRAIFAVGLAVTALSAFLGWLRLRRRDMSMIYEAQGWAVNAQMKLDRRLRAIFTRVPPFPVGSLEEKDQERLARVRRIRRAVLATVVVVAIGGAAGYLAWNPDARATLLEWLDKAWKLVTGIK